MSPVHDLGTVLALGVGEKLECFGDVEENDVCLDLGVKISVKIVQEGT